MQCSIRQRFIRIIHPEQITQASERGTSRRANIPHQTATASDNNKNHRQQLETENTHEI